VSIGDGSGCGVVVVICEDRYGGRCDRRPNDAGDVAENIAESGFHERIAIQIEVCVAT
jgi:hypothetical protein